MGFWAARIVATYSRLPKSVVQYWFPAGAEPPPPASAGVGGSQKDNLRSLPWDETEH